MTSFDLEDSAQLVEAIERDVEAHHRVLRGDLAEGTLRHLQRLAPVDEGEHLRIPVKSTTCSERKRPVA